MKNAEIQRKQLVKYLMIASVLLAWHSCGSSSGGSAATNNATNSGEPKASETSQSYTMIVASDADLPECSAANDKQLVYIKSSTTFKSCESGSWSDINIHGKDGASGLGIASNQLLKPSMTNICTAYASIENCYFNGGQLLKFTDGSIFLTGNYSYVLAFSYSAASGGTTEFDRLANSISIVIPPTVDTAFQRLDWFVSRGAIDGNSLYLLYDRASDTASIIFDTNGDSIPGAGDEVVQTITKSAW